MKKLALLLSFGLLFMVLTGLNCGGPDEVQPEQPDTTMVEEPVDTATPPPPPPPKKELKESQFRTIYFAFDKSNLRENAKAGLEHNYQLLQEYPDVIVQIEGHCDERGTVEYNLSLGERRAKSAQTYLISLGIAPERLTTISYGEERPAVEGTGEDVWSKNRRCEFRIISR